MKSLTLKSTKEYGKKKEIPYTSLVCENIFIQKTRLNEVRRAMISKDILGYKLGTTKDELTLHGGLALFGEFSSGLGLLDLLSNQMPKVGSNNGYKPSAYKRLLL